jgi:hypothetical protein
MSDAIGMLSIALVIASIGGCIVGSRYVDAQKEKAMTPQQMCVQRALTQADRIECLRQPEQGADRG